MSKFDGILSVKKSSSNKIKKSSKSAVQKIAEPIESGKSKKVGKRSHPDFTQITAYIMKNTHEKVMRKIYKRQEFSELLEELLADWLRKP